jgi:hypothetical protein
MTTERKKVIDALEPMKTPKLKWSSWRGIAWRINHPEAPSDWEILSLTNGCYTVNADGKSWTHLDLSSAKSRLAEMFSKRQVLQPNPENITP